MPRRSSSRLERKRALSRAELSSLCVSLTHPSHAAADAGNTEAAGGEDITARPRQVYRRPRRCTRWLDAGGSAERRKGVCRRPAAAGPAGGVGRYCVAGRLSLVRAERPVAADYVLTPSFSEELHEALRSSILSSCGRRADARDDEERSAPEAEASQGEAVGTDGATCKTQCQQERISPDAERPLEDTSGSQTKDAPAPKDRDGRLVDIVLSDMMGAWSSCCTFSLR